MTHFKSKKVPAVLSAALFLLAGAVYLFIHGRGEGLAIQSKTTKEAEEALVPSNPDETLRETDEDRGQGVSAFAEDSSVCVHVCGAVGEEGIFFLTKGARIADALEAAGGFSEGAATSFLNLAQPVSDGMKIYVPFADEVVAIPMVAAEPESEVGPVNINTADVSRLMSLPGIGEKKAGDIIAYREKNGPFRNAEDIMKVPGIKSALFDRIQNHICAR